MSTSDISNLAARVPAAVGQAGHSIHRHQAESDGHVVQFYADDLFLIDALSKFVGTALGAGDSAVVIATQAHLDALAQRLRSRGLDLGKLARAGRYSSLNAVDTLAEFMRDGQPRADLFRTVIGGVLSKASAAGDGGNPKVVAFGEMVALLWAEGNFEAAIQLEQLWNEIAQTHSFSLRCAYPLAGFSDDSHAEPFLKICTEHSAVIPAENYTALGTEDERLRNIAQLQQKAEAMGNEKALLRALRQTKEELEKEVIERREAQRRLCNSEQSLRELSGHLLRTQDEERRRLGRELHDSIGQYLAVLKMGLDSLNASEAMQGAAAASRLADCLNIVDLSLKELRTMSYLLYPPMLEEMGLKTAIAWYIDGFSRRSGIAVSFDVSPDIPRVAREIELAAFRVLQESLTNVHRHSGSGRAAVRLRVERESLLLEIKDFGKGIPASLLEPSRAMIGTSSVGLRGMIERVRHLGGTLNLSSQGGAIIVASLPCSTTNTGAGTPSV